MRLEKKSAIVTGGSRGIGAAIARRFVLEGANVLLNYNSSKEQALRLAENLSKETKSGGRVIPFKADVSNFSETKAMVSKALQEFGRIDILVNNAGIIFRKKFLETTEEDYDKVMNVNLKGVFFLTQQVVPIMLEQKKGKIINISSISGLAHPSTLTHPDYVASKAGLIGLTRSLAANLGPYINVNAICPGTIETDMIASLSDRARELSANESFLKRLGEPEDVAGAALFLASDDADFITGEIITVTGGRGMR
jgi:3-oxoacyl-[acyl-carrier protein] reductase